MVTRDGYLNTFSELDVIYSLQIVERRFIMGRIFDVFLVIGIILLVLWLMGLLTNYTFNGYVHIALIIGLICAGVWVLRRLIGSRR
jgi:hypothetical protein